MDVPKLTAKELFDKYGFLRIDEYEKYIFGKSNGTDSFLCTVKIFPGNCGYGVIHDFDTYVKEIPKEDLKKYIFGSMEIYRTKRMATNPGIFIATIPVIDKVIPTRYQVISEVLESISCLTIKTKNCNYKDHEELMYFIKDPSIPLDIPNIEIISHKV